MSDVMDPILAPKFNDSSWCLWVEQQMADGWQEADGCEACCGRNAFHWMMSSAAGVISGRNCRISSNSNNFRTTLRKSKSLQYVHYWLRSLRLYVATQPSCRGCHQGRRAMSSCCFEVLKSSGTGRPLTDHAQALRADLPCFPDEAAQQIGR